jgi:hypothetical protein
MTRALLLGKLPTFENGINHGRLDRTKTAKLFGLATTQVYKAYNNWIQIFSREPDSTLTFEQYLWKLKDAKITPDQVGNGQWLYNLSRYNDNGPYTNDSCRFILCIENVAEQEKFDIGAYRKGKAPWNKKRRVA